MVPRALLRLAPLLALASLTACTSAPARSTTTVADGTTALRAEVVRAIDGDTVDLRIPGAGTERARLLGIDTPETVKPNTPVQCFGPEASHRTKELLAAGTAVAVQRDREARDRYGRLLVYLWRVDDGLFVNRSLIDDGFARTLSISPNTAHRGELAAAESAARAAARGLWGTCPHDG